MTNEEWLACAEPQPMLQAIVAGSDRKLRLFAVACCCCIRDLMTVATDRKVVEIAERFADGEASEQECQLARHAAVTHPRGRQITSCSVACQNAAVDSADSDARRAAIDASRWARAARSVAEDEVGVADNRAEVSLIRDIFGNPFRPVALDPAWLTSDVLALARGIYEDRAFDRMPILADALQDADCTNEDVLSHCRDTQLAHVRGCWVVDLVLGKA